MVVVEGNNNNNNNNNQQQQQESEEVPNMVSVSSLPGVTNFLSNPCHLITPPQQQPRQDNNNNINNNNINSNNNNNQEMVALSLSNIVFANASLLGITAVLNHNCYLPFSLLTLPSPPQPFNTTRLGGHIQMHREMLYLAAHLYFALNYTNPHTSSCPHETSEFIVQLSGLTGMLENLLCRLTAMVGDSSLLTPTIQEVTALRLVDAASCAGRGLWMCILVSRARSSLVTLRRVFLRPSSAWQEGIRVVMQKRKSYHRARQQHLDPTQLSRYVLQMLQGRLAATQPHF
ncbi:hypothetical protein Pmani_037814 [Petrolisthes manimaculis]|uniref:Uncharacterized protein n=1 Tax=Petrolisthes manimaculis TaxID=1843537 RepID=A0AAE1TKT3_9EUCA|nr:hypothetical protein Pmani_037814 [Petrolisthes manimaculis]